ncbi:ribosome-binding factor A [Candidatus Kaiserbacteria bacterium]|nr:ribosome-binding factor A [Candidatus Kaiserbacteria bacterium]
MSDKRTIQIAQEIGHAASEFIARESNRGSLITVTRTELSSDQKHATIFLSVLPRDHEDEALLFVKRRTTDFREYLRQHTRFGHIPHIEVVLDEGEKNRQRIDDLTR